jgi:nitroreductase
MLGELLRSRRSVRDFLPRPIAPELLQAVLADANTAPSWSNTQPWRVAVASGAVRDQLQAALCARYDAATRAQRGGWLGKLRLLVTPGAMPDGDFKTNLAYPQDLQPRRRDTGHGLYALLGIARNDHAAREQQMRRNFRVLWRAHRAVRLCACGAARVLRARRRHLAPVADAQSPRPMAWPPVRRERWPPGPALCAPPLTCPRTTS